MAFAFVLMVRLRGLAIFLLLFSSSKSFSQSIYEPYAFLTVAGNAPYGIRDGTGASARFTYINVMASDQAGNLYAGDGARLRKITLAGKVTTIAGGESGNQDGIGMAAQFRSIDGLAVDDDGSIYVADFGNNALRKVSQDRAVTTLASVDGPGSIALDSSHNLYVLSGSNDGLTRKKELLKLSPSGSITPFASLSSLDFPASIAVDSNGNVFVSDRFDHAIYKITQAGNVAAFAGFAGNPGKADGLGTTARFTRPSALSVDSGGNVYVADSGNHAVRKITPEGLVSTLPGFESLGDPAGSFEVCPGCSFDNPLAVAADYRGNVFVGSRNNTILKFTPEGSVSVFAGMAGGAGDIDGIGESARFGRWSESLFSSGPIGLGSVVLDTHGNAFVTDGYNGIRKISPGREVITVAEVSGHGLATDSEGNLYVAEDTAIVKIAPSGELSTIAGAVREEGYVDGPGTVARFGRRTEMSVDGISGMTRDSAGNLYVLDPGNNAIREVSRFDDAWRVSTLGGFQDTNGNSVTLISRGAIAVDDSGTLYLMQGTALQKLTPAGTNWIVTTLAGSPTESGSKDGPGREARFAYDSQHGGYPMGIAVDKQHNVFVSDTVNNMIRKVSRNGMVTTLGGNFAVGSQDGIGALARFYSPHGIAASDDGTLYIADYGNLTFRKGFPAPVMESSGPGFGYTDGVFRSGITVPAGQLTVLEASTNLAQWTRLDTNVVGGSVPVSDSEAKSFSRRFYRTHLP